MKAILRSESYLKDSFEKFDKKIFYENWIYVGKESELLEENSFLTKTIGEVPVVIQRLKGKIRAFKNICSHRHSIIQLDKCGVRPLICPYHGWTYSNEGELVGVPKKPLFKFNEAELRCLRLKEFHVQSCGGLFFVHLAENPDTLENYLGTFYNWLAEFGNNSSELIDTNTFRIEANWKVLVENTLESYHVALVHSKTFQKLGTSGMNFQFDGKHSLWVTTLARGENDSTNKSIYQPFQNRTWIREGYEHLLIYPNLLLSTTFGVSFNISIIEPLDSENSIFESRVYLASYDTNSALLESFKEILINFNRRVFEEDKAICEAVQKGMLVSHYEGQLSEEELRVRAFQKMILEDINGN